MASAERSRRPMLEDALEYLGMGFPVFPVCSPLMGAHQHFIDGKLRDCTPDKRGKNPMTPWKAFQTTMPTSGQVRDWWRRWPDANIGMATGALAKVIVLDCDNAEARQLALEKGGLEKAPAVWTGTPGGIHFWMRHPGYPVKNFVKEIPGTDFRGDGGYVLLPPSLHAKGARYRWNEHTAGMRPPPVPDWLEPLFHGKSSATSTEDAPGKPLDLNAILSGISLGERDTTLYHYACKMRGDDVPQLYAEQMIRQAARLCDPAFDEDTAVEKVRRAYREFKPNADWSSLLDDDEDTTEAKAAEEPAPQVFLRPISELLAMPEVEPDWLVDQLFTVGSNGWVAAEPKVGKSWTVLELVYSLATGEPFLGRFAVKKPRRVVYIQEEDSLQRVLRRFKRLLKGDPSRRAPSDEYLRWSIRSGFKIDNPSWMDRLRQELEAYPAEVVVMDVFNRLHALDENKQQEMTEILNALLTFNNVFGCAFILVHHNKKVQAGLDARPNQMIRGSGVLAGWAECSLYLRRSKEQNTFIVTPESKDAPELDDFSVTLTDTENGGMVLEVGEAAPVERESRSSRADEAVVDAVRRISGSGVDATVQRVADKLKKERSGVQKRLQALAEGGYLEVDEVQIGRIYTKIYTVPTL